MFKCRRTLHRSKKAPAHRTHCDSLMSSHSSTESGLRVDSSSSSFGTRSKVAHAFHFSVFPGPLVNAHACSRSFGCMHSLVGNPGWSRASLSALTIFTHRSQHRAFSFVNVGYAEFEPTCELHAGKQHAASRRLLVFDRSSASSSSSVTTIASCGDSIRGRVRARVRMPARPS